MISKKSIIISLCVIVILAAAYFFISYDKPKTTQNEQKTDTVEKNSVIEPIFEVDKDSITSIKITNSSGIIEFYMQDGIWKLRDAENILYSQTMINSMIYDYVSLKPILLVEENAADTTVYGFDTPAATSEILTKDGKTAKFLLGDATKGDNGYYFMMEGDDNVYTVSTIIGNNMQKPAIDFREKKIIDVATDEITEITMFVQGIGEVNVKKSSTDDKTEISSWKMTKPYDIGVYDERFTDAVLTPVISVEATNILSDNPTDEQLKESGLADYQYFYEIKTSKGNYRVELGYNFDGYYVIKRTDIPTVFLVPQTSLEFLFTDVFEYIYSYAFIPKTEDISTISCISDSSEYTIECNLEDSVFAINGLSLSKDSFVDFYHEFFGIEIQGHTDTPPADLNNVLFEYTVSHNNGDKDIVSFIHMNGKYSYMQINGKIQFYVFAEDVQRIQNAVISLNESAGKNDITEADNKDEAETGKTGFNWVSFFVVILILVLVAAFPISLLRNNKKNK